ncbi:hypothetical protein RRG08_009915 [Elysia crispata]|uniref:Uncharacterized protein n=1 Tax=Elysia crispata TaxID=231223 RepID=A0AAE1E365_9GAST|nr:hypothetical protein RRG08_009915 [Elysia crispata]
MFTVVARDNRASERCDMFTVVARDNRASERCDMFTVVARDNRASERCDMFTVVARDNRASERCDMFTVVARDNRASERCDMFTVVARDNRASERCDMFTVRQLSSERCDMFTVVARDNRASERFGFADANLQGDALQLFADILTGSFLYSTLLLCGPTRRLLSIVQFRCKNKMLAPNLINSGANRMTLVFVSLSGRVAGTCFIPEVTQQYPPCSHC